MVQTAEDRQAASLFYLSLLNLSLSLSKESCSGGLSNFLWIERKDKGRILNIKY